MFSHDDTATQDEKSHTLCLWTLKFLRLYYYDAQLHTVSWNSIRGSILNFMDFKIIQNFSFCSSGHSIYSSLHSRTTDTQWRRNSKKPEILSRCGRQNMLWPYLKIWDCDLIFGRAVKAISSTGVRSPCLLLKGQSSTHQHERFGCVV